MGLFLALLVLLLGFAGLGGSGSGSSGSAPAPEAMLRLAETDPLTVSGTGFRPGERVVMKLVLRKSQQRRRVQANGRGSFRASFDVPVTRCDLVRVLAIRLHGRLVVLKRLPAPACAPVRTH